MTVFTQWLSSLSSRAGVSFPDSAVFGLIAVGIVGFVVLKLVFSSGSGKYSYPPGPRGFPILGNIPQLPLKNPGIQFQKWGKQYGDMFSVFMGSNRWVVINNYKTVLELLEKRGKLYLSRPQFIVTQDILSRGYRIVLMPHSERWRNLRKIMHQLLTGRQAEHYKPYQDVESKKLIWDYLQEPQNFHLHGARYANSVIFSVVFGRRTSIHEDAIRRLFKSIEDFMTLQQSPSASLIDGFPIIAKILPRWLQWYRAPADKVFNETVKVYEEFFDDLNKRIERGEDPQCFTRGMEELSKQYGFDDYQKYFCAGTIIEAGSDTTRNQINLMVAAAAMYPDWVKTAREQLDNICGDAERLPQFSDWNTLPYIFAVIKESLRWCPTMIPAGVPRTLVQDDTFGPYRFEKGTIFTWNQWGISHDENTFPHNEAFIPERFLNDELYDILKGHFGFGMGRRVCIGYFVALQNMFIAFSRILYCFDIVQDPKNPIDPRYIDPFLTTDAPFPVTIRVRSEKHRRLIEKECEEAGTAV